MIEDSPLRRAQPVAISENLWGALPRPLPALTAALATAKTWLERRRVRHELSGLDDRMLRDMGVTRYDVAQEMRTPLWRR
ncbi:MAG TPA: DUF1127 domain-containing protein [Azospirillum sp.]